MSLETFLSEPESAERTLLLANRTEPEPFRVMLEKLVDEQDIAFEEVTDEEFEDDTVVLVEDGAVVATSPLSALQDAILMVNSDLFITGTRKLEATDVPAVIDGLADHPFTLRGYPESNSEKLLLILISRHIERLAYEQGSGWLRSSFQYLSRLEDERGTREVYEKLAATDVDVHLYGRPDWTQSPGFPVTVHGGYKEDFRNSWFVVHRPAEDEPEHSGAALVAIEVDPGVWDGFWTYDDDLVEDIAEYIRRYL